MDNFYFKIDELKFTIEFTTNAYDLVKQAYDKIQQFEHHYRLLEAKIMVMDNLIEFAELNAVNNIVLEPLFEEIINIEL
jgi:hypothetical protein